MEGQKRSVKVHCEAQHHQQMLSSLSQHSCHDLVLMRLGLSEGVKGGASRYEASVLRIEEDGLAPWLVRGAPY